MNILTNRLNFSTLSLLDLFGGTGAISLEFLSRGTDDIDIIEIERQNCLFIRKTFTALEAAHTRVHRFDVRDWLRICRRQYDIIFADPPYNLRWLKEIPEMVMASAAVHNSTLLIIEHSGRVSFNQHPHFTEHRKYGNVNFSFFKKS